MLLRPLSWRAYAPRPFPAVVVSSRRVPGEALGFREPLNQSPTLGQAKLFAAYVAFRTKERIEYCGNYATLLTLHRSGQTIPQADDSLRRFDSAEYTRRRTIMEWEEQFREWAREATLTLAKDSGRGPSDVGGAKCLVQ